MLFRSRRGQSTLRTGRSSIQLRQNRYAQPTQRTKNARRTTSIVKSTGGALDEQGLAIGPSTRGFQVALVSEERWALHEEWRERRQRKVGHAIRRVPPDALVSQGQATAPQGGDETFHGLHSDVESKNAALANRENRIAGRLSTSVALQTHHTPGPIKPDCQFVTVGSK